MLLCPWDLKTCGNQELGHHGPEWEGVPVKWASNQHPQYLTDPPDPYVKDEPDRRTMSCGLCQHLKEKLGPRGNYLHGVLNYNLFMEQSSDDSRRLFEKHTVKALRDAVYDAPTMKRKKVQKARKRAKRTRRRTRRRKGS